MCISNVNSVSFRSLYNKSTVNYRRTYYVVNYISTIEVSGSSENDYRAESDNKKLEQP